LRRALTRTVRIARLRQRPAPLLAPLALWCAGAACAQSATLTASDAWIRATPGADVAAAYLTLHNGGPRAVTVSGVRSPAAAHAMLHESQLENGQARMRARTRLTLAPGASVQLAPGGLHVMLQSLVRPLVPGEQVALVLQLEGGGTLTVTARVRPLGAG
jgi:periplasmic copper chaperone A